MRNSSRSSFIACRVFALVFVVMVTAHLVTTCPGLCSCPTPEEIDCSNVGLFQVPDDLPSSATTVDLSGNSISALTNESFGGLPNLQSLDLTANNLSIIEDRTFSALDNLQILKLSNNTIEEVNGMTFIGLDGLSTLSLSYNPGLDVTEGALHTMLSLTAVDLSGCGSKAGKYKFADMRSLVDLRLADCDLHQLDAANFQNMESLETIDLSCNVFHSFPSDAIEAMGQLKVLNLRSNSVDAYDGKFVTVMSSITHLYLDENEIGLVSSDLLHDMRQLQQLTLTSNKIRTLPDTLFTGIPATGEPLQLELVGNPLDCDCNLRWLLKWGEDNTLDDVTCNEPEENKYASLKSLDLDDMACPPYEVAGKHIYHTYEDEEVIMGCPIFVDDYALVQWSYQCDDEIVEIPSTFPQLHPYSINEDHALVIAAVSSSMCDTYICEVTTKVASVSTELTLVVMTESKDMNGVVIALSVGISIFALLVIVALIMLGLKHRRQVTENRPTTGPYSNLTESMAEITTE